MTELPPVYTSTLPPTLTPAETEELRRLARRLSRHSYFKPLVEDFLAGRPLPPNALAVLIDSAGNRCRASWKERAVSILLLGGTPSWQAQDKERAAAELEGLLQRPRYVAPGCFYALGLYFLHFFFMIVAMFFDGRTNRLRAMAAASLGHLRVPSTVHTLVEAVHDKPHFWRSVGVRRVRRAAVAALPEALTSLTPDQYGRVPPETIASLCRLLYYPNEPLVLSTLEALGNVGGGSAVKSVERVSKKGRTSVIRETASRVLPRILERYQQELNPQRLLRAAHAPDDPAVTLLRPAGASGEAEVDTNMLLRPVLPGGNGDS